VIRCGIAGWIDRELIASKRFYPAGATSSEDRLRFYATQFPLVEVDSTYYALPSLANCQRWVERTPPDFRFDVKSFSLFTHHPTSPRALPSEIRSQLPPEQAARDKLYVDQLPAPIVDQCWEWFTRALEPLRGAGRLGTLFFQFPPWFQPSSRSLAWIEECQERTWGFPLAVEFRHRSWVADAHLAGTLDFLRRRDLAFVAVDAPQGFTSALPPVFETTSRRLSVVRFHGRNHRTWAQPGAPPSLRFRHNYTDPELADWVPRIRAMAEQSQEVHAIMNNNYSDWAPSNARRLAELMAAAGGPGGA